MPICPPEEPPGAPKEEERQDWHAVQDPCGKQQDRPERNYSLTIRRENKIEKRVVITT